MSYAQTDSGLLVPGHYSITTNKQRLVIPEHVNERKVIAFKGRIKPGEPWYGKKLIGHYNWDVDDEMIDGMTVRRHMRLWLTGIFDRVYGQFVWQDSDQMEGSLYIEEWSQREDTQSRWDRFVRREP